MSHHTMLHRPAAGWLPALSVWIFSTVVRAAPAVAQPVPANAELPGDAGGLFSEAFFLKLGFSFMIGLAMGFALKVAFKIALLVMGLILLALFLLQYHGVIDVDWSGFEVHYDTWIDWLGAHAGVFFGFVGDNLTSAASFLAGLALGFKY